MSVFQVKLNQTNLFQGNQPSSQARFLDQSLISGSSIQRSFYAMGPNKTSRKLADGATFVDVNYWKRFAFPTLPVDQAFIVVISDDGSPWYEDSINNSFDKIYTPTINDNTQGENPSGSHYSSSNFIDVIGDNGSPAISAMFYLTGSGTYPTFYFNGLTPGVVIPLNTSLFLDVGEFPITNIAIDNTQTFHAALNSVEIILIISNVARS